MRRKSAILVDFHTDYSEYWNCFHSLAIVGCVAYSTIVLNCSICLIWHLRNGVSYDQFFLCSGYLFTHRLRVMDTNFIKRHQFFCRPMLENHIKTMNTKIVTNESNYWDYKYFSFSVWATCAKEMLSSRHTSYLIEFFIVCVNS